MNQPIFLNVMINCNLKDISCKIYEIISNDNILI